MDAHFDGPRYTIGIEEELMILDAGSLDLVSAVESLLAVTDPERVKPELMESVLEIATSPQPDADAAGRELRALRVQVAEKAAERGLAIGAAGTHPFALWEEQRIVGRERYRGLVSDLGFVARQELLFGQHVHVGLDDREQAIHVANGMRVHLPVLLALSANSPFWRGDATGLASSRMPIFRTLPRVGIPPAYRDWADYEATVAFMVESGVIEDYTFMWHDVRPHPNLGTVEVRVMDVQTRVEHALGIAALIQAMVKELAEHFEDGRALTPFPAQMLDENKWLAARHGLDGELVDLPSSARVPTRELVGRLLERLRPHAEQLGSAAELAGIEDLREHGGGAARQRVVHEANHDLREVVAEIVAATAGEPR